MRDVPRRHRHVKKSPQQRPQTERIDISGTGTDRYAETQEKQTEKQSWRHRETAAQVERQSARARPERDTLTREHEERGGATGHRT